MTETVQLTSQKYLLSNCVKKGIANPASRKLLPFPYRQKKKKDTALVFVSLASSRGPCL